MTLPCPMVGPALQERRLPKRTYQPKRIRRQRRHGFLSRAASRTGRAVLRRRRLKGRWRLAV